MSSSMKKEILISIRNLRKYYIIKKGIVFKREYIIKAVDNVSFEIKKGEIFCIVGESGCGKTTLGKSLLRLTKAEGSILYDDMDILKLKEKEFKPYRRKMQMIFQDPYESLNPRRSVYDIVAQGIRFHKLADTKEEEYELVIKSLEEVDLKPPENFIHKYPHMLSGGQRQRVAIARVLVLRPEFIVADEPVSMLDVSTRVGVLNLLERLRRFHSISFLYITHDLATARYVCDRIGVMYLGKIVEMGSCEEVLGNPLHPYTKALIEAIPEPDPKIRKREISIRGEIASPLNLLKGCRFHPRCPYAVDKCRVEEPNLKQIYTSHYVACHLY